MGKIKVDLSKQQQEIIAARYANGVSQVSIAGEFGISRFVVQRVLDTEIARNVIKNISYDKVALEIAQNRKAIAELLPKAVEVILEQLQQKNLKAAELVIRASGMLIQDSKDGDKQQTAIQVILANGVNTPKEVPNDIQEG